MTDRDPGDENDFADIWYQDDDTPYPQDTLEYEPSDLEFREETLRRLYEAVDDYLTFGTMADLLKLIQES